MPLLRYFKMASLAFVCFLPVATTGCSSDANSATDDDEEVKGSCSSVAQQAVLAQDPAQGRHVSVTYYSRAELPPQGQAKYPNGDYCVVLFAPPGVNATTEMYALSMAPGKACKIQTMVRTVCGI
jgi:hypothetical protein